LAAGGVDEDGDDQQAARAGLGPASEADFDPTDPEPTLEREVGRIRAARDAEARRLAVEEAAAEAAAASKKKGKSSKGKKSDAGSDDDDKPSTPMGPFIPMPSVPPVCPAAERSPLYHVVRDFVLRMAAAVPLASEASRVRSGLLPRGAQAFMDSAAAEASQQWSDRSSAAEAADERIPRAEQRAHDAWALQHQADRVAEWILPVIKENERHSSHGLRGTSESARASGHGIAEEVQALVFGSDRGEERMMRSLLRLVKANRGVEDDDDDDSDGDIDDEDEDDEDDVEEPASGDTASYDASYAVALREADDAANAESKRLEAERLRLAEEAEAAAASGGKGKKGKPAKGKSATTDGISREVAVGSASSDDATAAQEAGPIPES